MELKLNGVQLFVDVQGDGPGTPIIGHHGAPGMSSYAEPKRALAKLADEHRIITFDARGSGYSEPKGPYTHEQWVADVDAIREHFGITKFIMQGGSYGGFITLEYALRHQDRLSHIILRDTSASYTFNEKAKQNALSRAHEFPEITEELLDKLFDGRYESDEDFRNAYLTVTPLYNVDHDQEETERAAQQMTFRHETHNFAFSRNLPNYDLRERLKEITVPVLITVGRHDWITPVEASEELHSLLPNSELVIFENSGHSPQIEENDKWIATIRDFLTRHS